MLGFSKLPILQYPGEVGRGGDIFQNLPETSETKSETILSLSKAVCELIAKINKLEQQIKELENNQTSDKETIEEWFVKFFNRT